MRAFLVATVGLVGAVVANHVEWPRNYDEHKVYPTGETSSTSTSFTSLPPHPHPTPTPPHPTTETLTTYTTETICPVTTTYGTQVITTLTTSTITITSCKGGCHPPAETPTPHPSGGVTKTEVITTNTYTFVPVSTSVGQTGASVIYSTYLSVSSYPIVYTTEVVYDGPPAPEPTKAAPITIPAECPAQATVTVTVGAEPPAQATVTVTVGAEPCKHCEIKTYTIIEKGTETYFTVTVTPTTAPTTDKPGTPTEHPDVPTAKPTSKTDKPPFPTGYSSSIGPSGTGLVPYPTYSHAGPKPTSYEESY